MNGDVSRIAAVNGDVSRIDDAVGHESKLLKNNKATPIKRSNVDDVYNRQIIYLFVTLVCMY